MTVRRECCDYCMWYGPVNQDGTMRKHYRKSDDIYGNGRQIKELGTCPGSHKPYARFGCDNNSVTSAPKENPTVMDAPAERFEILNLGRTFAVRDTTTGLDVAASSSRSGARHVIDCLADGSMALDAYGRARSAQRPAPTPASAESGAEYGLFNDEGCIEAGMFTRAEAEERRTEYIAEGSDSDDVIIKAVCPDHEGEPRDECGECFAEDNADEQGDE